MKTPLSFRGNLRALACLCAATALCGSSLLASDASDALKTLQAAVEKEAAQRKPAAEQGNFAGERGDVSGMVIEQLRANIARGEPGQVAELLGQVSAYFKSDAVRDATEKLRTALDAEQKARDEAAAARLTAAIDGASKAVRTAAKASDLDDTLRDLSHIPEEREQRYSEGNRGQMESLRNVRQFITHWQDYLAYSGFGNTQQALESLRDALNENSGEIIPRSEILVKINELSKAKAAAPAGGSASAPAPAATAPPKPPDPDQEIARIMEKTKTIDAIPAAIAALQPLVPANAGANDPFGDLRNELAAILQAYDAYRSGVPALLGVRASQTYAVNQRTFAATLPLRMEFLRLALPRILGAGDDLAQGAEETLQKYLDRVMAAAQQRADARLMGRTQDLLDKLSGRPVPLAFLPALLAAQNQEAAGQFLPAVISYETSLKIGGDLAPSRAIGARLEAIKKEHPADFEKGMQLFLSTPPPAAQVATPAAPGLPAYYYRQAAPDNMVVIPGSGIARPPAPAAVPPPSPTPAT